MGQSILLKRSAIPGKKPSANSINLGEVALNTYDGRIFFKRSGSSESVEEVITTNTINTGSIGLYGGVNNQNYLLNITGYNDYFQGIYLQNLSNSTSASSDVAIYNDNGTSYVDIGINSTTYLSSSEAFTTLGQSGDAYVYAAANNFYIGNASAGQEVVIFNGGFNTVDNAKITIHDQGSIVINKGQSYNPTYPEALVVNAAPGADFNLITAYNDTDNYSQINTRNLNSGSNASTDIVATADNGDEFLYYVDLGINSSGYNAGIVGEANDGYLINAGKNFYIGTQGDNYYGTTPSSNLYLFTNDSWQNPEIMISGSHVVGFGTTNVTNGYKYEFNGGDIKINNNVLVVGTLYATASNAVSASYAVTASYALNADGSGFPFSGSGVITGSLLISGSGGLNVLGPINGQDITASSLLVNGTITAQRLVVQTITASVEYVSGSTQFGSSSTDTHNFTGSVRVSGSLFVNQSVTALSFNGQINANNGIVSASSQIDLTQTTNYNVFSQSLAGTDASQSVTINNISQSAWGAFQSASAYSASAVLIDIGQNLRLNSLETFTSSILNINNFTASLAGTNAFTQSTNFRLNALETASASVISRVNSIESFTSSFSASNYQTDATQSLNITITSQSAWGAFQSASAYSASTAVINNGQNLRLDSLETFTASAANSLSSINSKTGSFATTGSNTFQGNQIVNGTITAINLVVTTITASTEYASGSTRFGSNNSNTHEFTGSVKITGSLDVVGSVTGTSFTGQINANNGVVSGSSQITISSTTGYTAFSQSLADTDTTQSLNITITSQSAWGAFQSASAYSSSAAVVDNVQTLRLNNIETFTASISNINNFTASIANTNAFTQSAILRLNALETSSASVISRVNSIESFTSSFSSSNFQTDATQSARLNAIEIFTSSIAATNTFTASILGTNTFTASIAGTNTFTQSAILRLNALENVSASTITRLGNLETFTGSFSASNYQTDVTQSLNITIASQSAWGAFQSASAYSASAATVDNAQNLRLNALENVSASTITRLGNLETFTASAANSLSSINLKTGSFATTGSNTFVGNQIINGTLNVTNIIVTTITASTEYASGSTRFGSNNSNTHEFTGSVKITGSLNIVGPVTGTSFSGQINANNGIVSGSSQITISSTTGYTEFSQSLAGTDASQSVSILISSQSAWGAFQSASAYSASAAVVDNAQNLRLNSIELKTGSFATTGSNSFIGTQTITGSLNVSGSNYSYTGYSTAVGANTISSIATGSYNGAFYNYVAISGSNARAGQISAIWLGNTITYTETTTTDIGNTNGVTMAVQISSGFVQLLGTTTTTPWTIKTSINLI